MLIGNPIEYWGIPEWVYNKMEAPEHPYPWPMKDTSGFNTWACGYFSQTVSNAFQQLYSNKAGTADYFANFWVQVMELICIEVSPTCFLSMGLVCIGGIVKFNDNFGLRTRDLM